MKLTRILAGYALSGYLYVKVDGKTSPSLLHSTARSSIHSSSSSSSKSYRPSLAFAFPDLKSIFNNKEAKAIIKTDKDVFLESLDQLDTLNASSQDRDVLLDRMINNKVEVTILNNFNKTKLLPTTMDPVPAKSLENPGLEQTFQEVATGTWKVIYAPHMTTFSGFFGGAFDVTYKLNGDFTMESHAKYNFPVFGCGYLSVSGTYGSVDKTVSRVDFDQVWIKPLNGNQPADNEPYATLEEVPESNFKSLINAIGQTFFIDSVSVFPVSFLDDEICVFNFELLGTRICAKKVT